MRQLPRGAEHGFRRENKESIFEYVESLRPERHIKCEDRENNDVRGLPRRAHRPADREGSRTAECATCASVTETKPFGCARRARREVRGKKTERLCLCQK